MSALIQLVKGGKPGAYLGVTESDRKYLSATSDNMGVHIKSTEATLLSGKEAGARVSEIKINQLVRIRPAAALNPTKYTIMLGYNPELGKLGTISCSPIIPPNGDDIYLTIKAYKNFSLEELDYVFTVYMLD